MEEFRITKEQLWDILEEWDRYIHGEVHLVACGGTALTIQGIKPSTKDVDFLVPKEREYVKLIQTLKKLGYKEITGSGWGRGDGFIFDLFPGKKVYVTELLDSPLKSGNNVQIKKFKKLYIGALNDYDLVITKMFRGSSVDMEDCLALIHTRGEQFNLKKLQGRYEETAQYDVNPQRMLQNLKGLTDRLQRMKENEKK